MANKFKKGLGFRSNKWRDSQLNHFKLCNTNNKIPKELTYRYLEFVKIIKKNSKKKKGIDTISWMWVVVLD